MSQFDWPILKKFETMKAPQNRIFYGKMKCPPFGLTYIGEKERDLWAKHMGLKRGAIGNTLGEHLRNLGNILRMQ
jgi:hypothetical protein